MKMKIQPPRYIERGSYDSLAAALRQSTGRKRLTPAQAAEVRAAVALHKARHAPGRESGSVREIVQAVGPQGLDHYVRAAIAVAVARATR